jgi:hypothetical protein
MPDGMSLGASLDRRRRPPAQECPLVSCWPDERALFQSPITIEIGSPQLKRKKVRNRTGVPPHCGVRCFRGPMTRGRYSRSLAEGSNPYRPLNNYLASWIGFGRCRDQEVAPRRGDVGGTFAGPQGLATGVRSRRPNQ